MAAHNEKGILGEKIALLFLQTNGYSILHSNWRYQKTEVDIIAKIGNTLVFVEVKTRSSEYFGLPESFVTEAKKRSFGKAAEAYCQNYEMINSNIRYDIMAVIINKKEQTIQHFEDAFFPEMYI